MFQNTFIVLNHSCDYVCSDKNDDRSKNYLKTTIIGGEIISNILQNILAFGEIGADILVSQITIRKGFGLPSEGRLFEELEMLMQ